MTKRVVRPKKRGRKSQAPGANELVYLRWRSFFRQVKSNHPKMKQREIGALFIEENSNRVGLVNIGSYDSLRKVIYNGRIERTQRRERNWGIITNVGGRGFLVANRALHLAPGSLVDFLARK